MLSQPLNASSAIVVTELPIVTDFSPVQPENAQSCIIETEFGISIDVKREQPENIYNIDCELFTI